MDTEAALLAALHADPADDVAWLALADWLEEHGRADQGRLLRLHRGLRAMPEGDDKAERSLQVQGAINAGLRPAWPRLTNSIGMELALIPAGAFLMGSPRGEKGRCADEALHEVEITRPFYLGVFPVTQAQYRAVTRRNPSAFSPRGSRASQVRRLATNEFPVETVSWGDAVAFCDRLSARKGEASAGRIYRLPTEAEWEYACRAWGASALPFHLGRTLTKHLAWHDRESDEDAEDDGESPSRTGAVGQFPPNAFGLHDLHGNVDEWCADWYGTNYYKKSPRRDPPGPAKGGDRVLRGGSYFDGWDLCRAAVRYWDGPDESRSSRGFRVVCEWR